MRLISARTALYACSALFLAGLTQNAMATCAADISKVEYAIDHAKRTGIDITDAERMRALLEDANKERKAGNEKKCQELIDQAKRMGNVE
ncbi:hypothetical protein [Roseibium sp.]|uniref:hypothetical protein n=1 Tax=Roseibium sp. TaxID=1936156 RepID=UPI003BAC8E6F